MVRLPRARSLVVAASLVAAACGGENPNATRNQGEDCDSCHKPGGKAPRSLFTASGSVFRSRDGEPLESGAKEIALTLTDATGRALELKTNSGGNFHTTKELAFPVRVALRTLPDGAVRQGPEGVCAHGNCNLCHHPKQPTGGARGRLVRP
jgi:putative hemolysin